MPDLKAAEQAQKEAITAAEEAVEKHVKAAISFREAGELSSAAYEYENASIRSMSLDVDAGIGYMEQAAKLFGQAGNYEKAADCAFRCANLMRTERYGSNQVARLYMAAKNYYGNDGAYPESGASYVEEMKARTELEWREAFAPAKDLGARFRHIRNWTGLTAWGLVCTHGEGIGRLLLWFLAVVMGFAFAYWRAGALGPTHTSYWDAVVFSAATVTSHGVHGYDLKLGQPWPLIVMAEVFLGYGFLALFASILVRKLSRR